MCKKCIIVYPEKRCRCKCDTFWNGGNERCENCGHWINDTVIERNKIANWVGALFISLDAVLVYYIGTTDPVGISQYVDILIGDFILFAALECFWVGRKRRE